MDMINIPLQPSPTYVERRCVWMPAYLEWGPIVGVLSVQEKRTAGSQPIISRYAVVELRPEEFRRFQFTKPGGYEVYYVELNKKPDWDLCDCEGFATAGHCKHRDSLRALQQHGYLPKLEERIKFDVGPDLHLIDGGE